MIGSSRLIAFAAALVVSACVTSKVEQIRQSNGSVTMASGESVVVLGRRQRGDRETEKSFNKCVSKSLAQRKLPIYTEQSFVDAIFPWMEPRTAPTTSDGFAALLEDAEIAQRVRATGVRFMVWIDGETDRTAGGGSVSCGILPPAAACLGFGWWDKESKYEVSVWDVQTRSSVGRISVNASGTSYLPAIIIPIPMIARTEAAACEGVAGQVGELLIPAATTKPRS